MISKFRKFGNSVFNIDDISVIKAVSEYEEWGDDVELVEYMAIYFKCGAVICSESAYKRFGGDAHQYLEYIIKSSPTTDVA